MAAHRALSCACAPLCLSSTSVHGCPPPSSAGTSLVEIVPSSGAYPSCTAALLPLTPRHTAPAPAATTVRMALATALEPATEGSSAAPSASGSGGCEPSGAWLSPKPGSKPDHALHSGAAGSGAGSGADPGAGSAAGSGASKSELSIASENGLSSSSSLMLPATERPPAEAIETKREVCSRLHVDEARGVSRGFTPLLRESGRAALGDAQPLSRRKRANQR